MHFNTCNKLLEQVNRLKREIEEVKDRAVEHTAITSSCLRLLSELDYLKEAIKDARTV